MFSKDITFKKKYEEKNHYIKKKDTIIDLLSTDDDDNTDDVILIKEIQKIRRNDKKKKMVDKIKSVIISSESESSEKDFDDDININIHSWESDGNVSDVNTEVVVKWNKVESPKGWTKTMKKYYNKPCYHQKYFDWKKILQEIRLDRSSFSSWNILDRDICPIAVKRRRCYHCRQTDHLSHKCPRKNVTCSMCGIPGHPCFRCPQTMCLNCGIRKGDYVDYCSNCNHWRTIKCFSCKKYGHESKNCTDLWRRFHSTVAYKDINSSPTSLNKNLQCCNCAKPGHLYEDCTEQYFSSFMPANSLVTNYNDISDLQFNSIKIQPQTSNKILKRSYSDVISISEEELIDKKLMRIENNRQNNSSNKQNNLLNIFAFSFQRTLNKSNRKRRRKKKTHIELE